MSDWLIEKKERQKKKKERKKGRGKYVSLSSSDKEIRFKMYVE